MPYVLVHQTATDYAQWRRVFDQAAALRAEAGCTGAKVLRDSDNPNQLAVLFEFADLERAERYIDNPRLRQAWQRAGVVGETQIHLLTGADEG